MWSSRLHRTVAGFETFLAWLVIGLMTVIVAQVFCSALDVNPVARFDLPVSFLGKAVTLNSLLDSQWHLLVVIGLMPAGIVWLRDGHVRVDFVMNRLQPAGRARVDLCGNLLFAFPFLVMILPAAVDFALRALTSGEGSRNGGLNDLWLVKSVLPLGLALLGLAILIESLRLLRPGLPAAPGPK